MIMFQLHWW